MGLISSDKVLGILSCYPAGALHGLLGSRELVYSWMILSLVVPYLVMDHLQSLEYHKIDPMVELPVRIKRQIELVSQGLSRRRHLDFLPI